MVKHEVVSELHQALSSIPCQEKTSPMEIQTIEHMVEFTKSQSRQMHVQERQVVIINYRLIHKDFG